MFNQNKDVRISLYIVFREVAIFYSLNNNLTIYVELFDINLFGEKK